jgi:hypothetical protein
MLRQVAAVGAPSFTLLNNKQQTTSPQPTSSTDSLLCRSLHENNGEAEQATS